MHSVDIIFRERTICMSRAIQYFYHHRKEHECKRKDKNGYIICSALDCDLLLICCGKLRLNNN